MYFNLLGSRTSKSFTKRKGSNALRILPFGKSNYEKKVGFNFFSQNFFVVASVSSPTPKKLPKRKPITDAIIMGTKYKRLKIRLTSTPHNKYHAVKPVINARYDNPFFHD